MPTCDGCGNKVFSIEDYCPDCGESLGNEEEKDNSETSTVCCPECGNRVLPQDNYCQNCGTKVSLENNREDKGPEKENSETSKAYCPECGNHVLPRDNYCQDCGTKVYLESNGGGDGSKKEAHTENTVSQNDTVSAGDILSYVSILTAGLAIYFPIAKTHYQNTFGENEVYLVGGFAGDAVPQTYTLFPTAGLLLILIFGLAISKKSYISRYILGSLYGAASVTTFYLIQVVGNASNRSSEVSSNPELGSFLLVSTALLLIASGILKSFE